MRPRTIGFFAVLALGMAFMAPRPAAAYTWDFICGGDTGFSLCASVSISFENHGDGTGTISMTVQNLSDSPLNPSAGLPGVDNTVLTKVGLFNTPGSYSIYDQLSIPTGWEASTALNSSGGQDLDFGTRTTNGVNYALPTETASPGNSILFFSFKISGSNADMAAFAAALEAGEIGLSIHGQSGVNGGSTTCLTAGENANCDGTTVPEPATLLLLGTGMAGIAAIRRRRQGIEEEEA